MPSCRRRGPPSEKCDPALRAIRELSDTVCCDAASAGGATMASTLKITRLQLHNWKNFREVDVGVPDRLFLIGPNAAGKSNFLDAFRFLHDLASSGGGLVSVRLSRWAVVEYAFRYFGCRFVWPSASYGDLVSMPARLSLLHDDVVWRWPVRTRRLAVAGWRLGRRHREEIFFRHFLFCACLMGLGSVLFVHA